MLKDAFYFSHDTNAREDMKIKSMMKKHGAHGYGWFWIIVESLACESEYRLKMCEYVFDGLAIAMLCETIDAESFVNDCINRYELFKTDGCYFWSESLNRRMALKQEKSKKRSEAGKKGAKSRWKTSEIPQDDSNTVSNECQTHGNAIAKDSKVKESKVKESKVKESKVKENDVEQPAPAAQNTVDFNFKKIANYWNNNMYPLGSFEAENIDDWLNDFEADTIILAIAEACANNKRTLKYVQAILTAWKQKGIRTQEQAQYHMQNKNAGENNGQKQRSLSFAEMAAMAANGEEVF